MKTSEFGRAKIAIDGPSRTLVLGCAALLLFGAASRASTLYVDANSPNPAPPYATWATAATKIQDAVDASAAGDEIVVTNGVYATGGRGGNRVAVDRQVTMRSVNGPQFTSIQAVVPGRCVYLTNGASLSGFTLTGGRAYQGGGAWSESTNAFVSHCVLVDNYAAGGGGGAYQGTLDHCMLTNNYGTNGGGLALSVANDCAVADTGPGLAAVSSTLNRCVLTRNSGGAESSTLNNCLLTDNNGTAAIFCTLNNCTITGNYGSYAGGAAYSTLNNCIVYSNTGDFQANYYSCNLSNCCTMPLPPAGAGNIPNAPVFLDALAGDFRLQPSSPCINAGNNSYVATATDLAGNPRIVNGTVDMGAYEFQGSSSLTGFHAWLAQYALPTDGSADYTDPDRDGMNNWQEWICGTNPTNAASTLCLLTPTVEGTNITLNWQSAVGIGYFVQRSTNLGVPGSFLPLATNLPGQAGTTTFTDTNASGVGPFFYRVGVGN